MHCLVSSVVDDQRVQAAPFWHDTNPPQKTCPVLLALVKKSKSHAVASSPLSKSGLPVMAESADLDSRLVRLAFSRAQKTWSGG